MTYLRGLIASLILVGLVVVAAGLDPTIFLSGY
jgi:hypothetical protein